MKRWFQEIAVVLGAGLLLSSCGQPGAPQAPSLELPKAVDDLAASRKGDRVTLRWTAPNRFTDGRMIQRVGPTRICRSTGKTPAATCEVVGTNPAPAANPKDKRTERSPMEYQDVLTAASATGSVMYGVEVLNTHGRSVGMSSQVEISTAPALAAPSRVAASVGNDGVTVTWGPIAAPAIPEITFAYQISRRGETGDFAAIASVPIEQSKYVDLTFEWEKKFEYRIAVVTQRTGSQNILVEGEDSQTASVFAHDVFPPAQPRELQAVFSGPGQQKFIDLSWAPNLEPDLAGYNVYRHEEGAAPVKINAQLVTSPSLRDEHVEAGKTYFYAVSAVDVRGNESERSAETSENVP